MRELGRLMRKLLDSVNPKFLIGIAVILLVIVIFSQRHNKEQVSTLPPPLIEPVVAPLTPEQWAKIAPPVPELTPEEKRQARKDYAKKIDQGFIDAGIESTTNTFGPADTTLVIHDVLAGRVRANIIGKSLDFELLKKLGFKEVVYNNGFIDDLEVSFSWKVR